MFEICINFLVNFQYSSSNFAGAFDIRPLLVILSRELDEDSLFSLSLSSNLLFEEHDYSSSLTDRSLELDECKILSGIDNLETDTNGFAVAAFIAKSSRSYSYTSLEF